MDTEDTETVQRLRSVLYRLKKYKSQYDLEALDIAKDMGLVTVMVGAGRKGYDIQKISRKGYSFLKSTEAPS